MSIRNPSLGPSGRRSDGSGRNLEWIQVGRGIAALLVVMAHADLLCNRRFGSSFLSGFFDPGNVGVDFFFALSGFIIYYIHAADIGTGAGVQRYFWKRLTRIFPMYWIVSGTILVAVLVIPSLGSVVEKELTGGYLLSSFLLLPQDALPLLSVGWTLTHEMYFYALFGLLIVLPKRVGHVLMLVILGGTLWKLAADIGHPLTGGSKYKTGQSFLDNVALTAFLFSRHNLLFVGGVLTALVVLRGGGSRGITLLALVSGTLFFFVPFVGYGFDIEPLARIMSDKVVRACYYAIASSLSVYGLAMLTRQQLLRPPRLMRYLGDASYSIYLLHYPALLVGFIVVGAALPAAAAFPQLATLAISLLAVVSTCVGYTFVERPIQRYLASRSVAGRPPVSPGAGRA